MYCGLMLVFSVYLNPCNINYMDTVGTQCYIYFSGSRQASLNIKCVKVLDRIVENRKAIKERIDILEDYE